MLGADANLLMNQIDNKSVHVAINKEWQEGMASSLRCGVQKLLELEPAADAVILMVCDQPFVSAALLDELVIRYEGTRKTVVASSYGNNMGTPALFDKTIFAALLALKGDAGAKKLIKENPGWVEQVNFPLGNIDIDTDEDYDKLLHLEQDFQDGRISRITRFSK